jgi:hypothetical protein
MNFRTTFLFLFLFTGASAQDSLQVNFYSVFSKVIANQIQCKTLSERTTLTWDDGYTAQQFNANIRVKKDSLIWMSLGMFGFEGARVLISPDSFRLINKLTNEYMVRDYNFIQSWILMPVSFEMLQQIIAGEKISIKEKAKLVALEDSSYVLYHESDKLLEKIWVDTQNYTLKKILLKDKLMKQDMTINFDSYNSLNAKPFSYKRSIVIHRDAVTMKLSMDITKAHMDEELNFPFEVNEKYKRVE